MLVEWFKKAPTAVVITTIVVCGFLVLAVLGAYVALSIQGVDTTDLRQGIQTVGTVIILPLLGINTIASISSARSASNAEEQTNGIHAAKDAKIAQLTADLQHARGHSEK